MKVSMFCTTNNFTSLKEDFDILSFKFTSKIDETLDTILTESSKKMIGNLAVGNFKSSPYFYAKTSIDIENDNVSDDDIETVTNNSIIYFSVVESFVSFLWLIKDNCCSINTFYTHLVEGKKLLINANSSNYFTAEGLRNQKVFFSTSELEQAVDLFVNGSLTFHHKNIKLGIPDDSIGLIKKVEMKTYDYTKITRIERAFNFLKLARTTSELPQKIAFYICIYESLFYGTSSGEITHQIAERVALYISKTRVFRKSIYKQVKEAYKIRSTYFHGNSIKKNQKELVPISSRLDYLTRQVLYRVIKKDSKIFLQADQLLEESFQDLIFEDERKPDGVTFELDLAHLRFNS